MNRSRGRVEKWEAKIDSISRHINKLYKRKKEIHGLIKQYKACIRKKKSDWMERKVRLAAEMVASGKSIGSVSIKFGIKHCEAKIRNLLWSKNPKLFHSYWCNMGTVNVLRHHYSEFGLNLPKQINPAPPAHQNVSPS